MRRRWGYVFSLCLALASVAQATDPPLPPHTSSRQQEENERPKAATEETLKLFEKAFGDKKTYLKGACCDNICRLVTQMKAKKIDLSRAKVLYILKQAGGDDLYPQRARQGIAIWGFHVVLEVDGEIFDFDYSQAPEAVPSRKYFTSMFVLPEQGTAKEEEEQLKGISLRAVPAKEYLADFGPVCDYDAYLKDTVKGRKYPAQSAWDFLGPPLPKGITQFLVQLRAPLRGLFR